jgi:GDPmannose 4,6-dehydratase
VNHKDRTAVITGITGQDGAYLAKLLLGKGYQVYGTYRRTSSINFWRLHELGIAEHPQLRLVEYDLTDLSSTIRLLESAEPQEFYNLAAQSFVGVSFEQPITTTEITGLGTLNILEAIRIVDKSIRFYQASTSEMFGKVQTVPQHEDTPFYPRSPYGIAKLFAHWSTINYRESYDIFAVSGILFNHESPLRGKEFVTRKITFSMSQIASGRMDRLELGNLDAERDWGYAPEYVEGMWRMLQTNEPETFVLATGRTASVRKLIELTCEALDIPIEFQGEDENEQVIDRRNGKVLVSVNADFFRPTEVDLLVGDPSKALSKLGWKAETTLESLCEIMVQADLSRGTSSE